MSVGVSLSDGIMFCRCLSVSMAKRDSFLLLICVRDETLALIGFRLQGVSVRTSGTTLGFE